ncbi:MAG: hypothetical protein OEM62_01485 [Acidobacteriota bacterium]|nr:hypothetical protein [Acidobacteriota bacterium]
MNWKLIVLGGLVFYAVMMVISFPTGALIHEGVLDESYRATNEFWQPALRQDPPDMAAMMPRWIATGLITTFIFTAIYGWMRGAFSGAPWLKGLKFGLMLSIIGCCFMAGWSGVFNLPSKIWMWWGFEQFLYYLPGGAVLGWVGQKLAPEGG